MSPFSWSILGMFCLAIPFAALGRYFFGISSEYIVPIVYASGLLILAPLGYYLAKVDGAVLSAPTAGQVAVIVLLGILLGLGDYATVKAFNDGGSTTMVAAVFASMPAVATVLVGLTGGGWPSAKGWAGIALIAAGLFFVRGELQDKLTNVAASEALK